MNRIVQSVARVTDPDVEQVSALVVNPQKDFLVIDHEDLPIETLFVIKVDGVVITPSAVGSGLPYELRRVSLGQTVIKRNGGTGEIVLEEITLKPINNGVGPQPIGLGQIGTTFMVS